MSRFKVVLSILGVSAAVAATLVALNLTPGERPNAAPTPSQSSAPSVTPTPKPSPTEYFGDGDKDKEEEELGNLENRKVKPGFVANAVHHDVSEPLRSISSAKPTKIDGQYAEVLEEKREASKPKINKALVKKADPAVQKTKFGSTLGTTPGLTPAMPTATAGFNGLGSGFPGFTVQSAPPDTNMDVSSTQIVQVVNSSIVVLSKTGAVLSSPKALQSLWSSFGGDCAAYSDGDPTVVFDRIANRWIIGQFAISQNETAAGYLRPYLECVAVSQTADATGAYNRYAFGYTFFNDYPKMSVWPDAYYTTFNGFTAAGGWDGGYICAYERDKMIAGLDARQKCVRGSSQGGILVASVDNGSAPTLGTDAYALSLDGYNTSRLELWRLDLSWGVTPSFTVSSTSYVTVPSYSWACPSIYGWTCVPQKGTTNQLDTLGDRLMSRFSYVKTATGQVSFVASHTADVSGTTAVRWYELRASGAGLVNYQSSTYQPDINHRWMPSIAMDRMGNIGMVYSKSSSTLNPSIVTAGRLVTDTLGTLGQGETTVKAGTGSQTGTLSRWGDYASMVIDPADSCTFWSSTEYLSADGTFNWKTWISKFKFANCVADATTYTLTGPTSGGVGVASSNFTVTTNGPFVGTITVTPAGAGVDTTPIDLVFDGTSTTKTFTVTPTAVGTVTFTVSNSGTLTNPTSLPSYVSAVLATSFTFTGPTDGYKGQPSTAFTVTPDGTYSGTITITRTGAGNTGSTVLTFNASSAAQTFSFTPAATGTVTLTATNSGSLTNPSPLNYSVTTPPPAITSITASGAIGSTVTITGTALSNVTRVKIGSIGVASFKVVSASTVTAVVAAGTVNGQITVVDSSSQTATSSATFLVSYATSTATTISPISGKVGTSLTLTGTNLGNVSAVTVAGVAASSFTVNSTATRLYVAIPAGVTIGSGKKVVVTTPNGDVTSTGSFSVTSGTQVPMVSRLSTSRGAVGSAVTITGSNLASADVVAFNGVAAPFVVLSDTSILVGVPNSATGSVTVHTPGGTSSGIRFTYSGGAVSPTIASGTGISPTAATVGNWVTISGNNLAGLVSVSLNGVTALQVKKLSATQFMFLVPVGATTGTITITTTGGSVTSSATVTIY